MDKNIGNKNNNEFLLLGMGNPLLDLQVATLDTQIHAKYGLAEDGADLINSENSASLLPIFDDISTLGNKIEFVPGGSAQNTVRVCQWMVKAFGVNLKSCYFFGAVGKDKYGQILHEKAQAANIEVRYQEVPTEKTGTCAVLVFGNKRFSTRFTSILRIPPIFRSLVAHLGAAEHFTPVHLNIEANQSLIEKISNFYVEGYFLTVSLESILFLATHVISSTRPKHFALNLSAEYICQFFSDRLEKVLPYVDILFGNKQEALAYAKTREIGKTDVGDIALYLSEKEKVNGEKKRIVVITQGPLPVLVAHDRELTQFPVEPISEDKIVDTNGAGDAFCGGFLAAFSTGRSLDLCVRAGNFAARTIIQQIGCTFPNECAYLE